MTWRAALFLAASIAATSTAAETYRFDVADDYLAPSDQWDMWRATEAAFAADFAAIEHCADPDADCSGNHRAVNRLLARLKDVEPESRVKAVNAWVNRRRYRDDRSTTTPDGRMPNEWRSLSDLLRRGGDCEDFAMAKYFLLRQVGIPAEQMRVVVAWDRPTRAYHALLAYDTDAGAWLIETDGSIRRNAHGKYRFLYSINELGVWDHAPAEGATTARRNRRESS